MRETFSLQATISPDYSIGANWSDGMVPGLGSIAVIDNATVLIDPETVLSAAVVLRGAATLSGNGGGFSLGAGGAIIAQGHDALFADGAIVNHATIKLAGHATSLRVVVEDGSAIAQSYGLAIPSLENAGGIAVTDGATLTVAGTEFSNIGGILVNQGHLEITGGAVDGGQGAAPPGGEITLENHATASFSDGVADQNFQIYGATTIDFHDVAGVADVTIAGFDFASKILLPSFAQGRALLDNLAFTDLPSHTAPVLIPASAGAELLLEPVPPCFARGTRLLTPAGYAPVEQIRPGDPVVTIAGTVRKVRWTGFRGIDIATHRQPEAVRPVRILPGAFGPNMPAKHLRLSPDHALLLRGRLVPVKLLVNGATIRRERNCLAVTYFHIELDRHDVLLAENLAVESYLDTGNRGMFETAAGTPRKNPVFGRGRQWNAEAYADLCLGGPILRDIRHFLRARALELGYRPRTLTDVSLWTGGIKYLRHAGTPANPVFRLATPHPGRVNIRSPVFVPAEMTSGDADEDDNRLLGIAIEKLRLGFRTIKLRDVALGGFHPRAGRDGADWTDGNASIEVPKHVAGITLKLAALPQGWSPPAGSVALDI